VKTDDEGSNDDKSSADEGTPGAQRTAILTDRILVDYNLIQHNSDNEDCRIDDGADNSDDQVCGRRQLREKSPDLAVYCVVASSGCVLDVKPSKHPLAPFTSEEESQDDGLVSVQDSEYCIPNLNRAGLNRQEREGSLNKGE